MRSKSVAVDEGLPEAKKPRKSKKPSSNAVNNDDRETDEIDLTTVKAPMRTDGNHQDNYG